MHRNSHLIIDEVIESESRFLLPSSQTAPYSVWKGSSLAKRLNIFGTVTCVLDTAIHLAASRSKEVSNFFTETIPYYISASYYILPTAGLLVLYLKNQAVRCYYGDHESEDDNDDHTAELINKLSEVDGFDEFINQTAQTKQAFVDKLKEFQKPGCIGKLDVFINILYFSLRALQGGLIIIKAHDLSSKDVNDSIQDWSDFISNVINAAYLVTMLMYNTNHGCSFSSCHSFFSRKESEPVNPVQELNINDSSVRIDLK